MTDNIILNPISIFDIFI